jgi:putative transposase
LTRQVGPRLVGAVFAEQYDEWAEQRRHMGLELIQKSDAVIDDSCPKEMMLTAARVG